MTIKLTSDPVSAVPAALSISPEVMAIYSETQDKQRLVTITKNVTKVSALADGSIRLDRKDGAFAVFGDWTDDRGINLAQLAREAAERQGITIQEQS